MQRVILLVLTLFCGTAYPIGGHDGAANVVKTKGRVELADDYFSILGEQSSDRPFVPSDARKIDFDREFAHLDEQFRFISRALRFLHFDKFTYRKTGYGNPLIKTPYFPEDKPDFNKYNFYYVDQIPRIEDCIYEYSEKVIAKKTFPTACTSRDGKDILIVEGTHKSLTDFDQARVIYHELFRTIRPKVPTLAIAQIIKSLKVIKNIYERQTMGNYEDLSGSEMKTLFDAFESIKGSSPKEHQSDYDYFKINRRGGGLQASSKVVDDSNFIGVFSEVRGSLGKNNVIIASEIDSHLGMGSNNIVINSMIYGSEISQIGDHNRIENSELSRAKILVSNNNSLVGCHLEGLNKSSGHLGVIHEGSQLILGDSNNCRDVELHFDSFNSGANSVVEHIPQQSLQVNDYIYYDNIILKGSVTLRNIDFTNRIDRKPEDFYSFENVYFDWEVRDGRKRMLTLGEKSVLQNSRINYLDTLAVGERSVLSNVEILKAYVGQYKPDELNIAVSVGADRVLKNQKLEPKVLFTNGDIAAYYAPESYRGPRITVDAIIEK